MPISPPVHRPKGYKPKEKWQRSTRTTGKTTTERGYGWQWQQIRKRIIKRDFALCQPCKEQGYIKPFEHVDHIISKANGGTDDDANLQCICIECHMAKTAAEKQ